MQVSIFIKAIFLDPQKPVKAVATVMLGEDYAVHNVKLVQGTDRLFVSMPSEKKPDGRRFDICHPARPEAREELEALYIEAYRNCLDNSAAEHLPE